VPLLAVNRSRLVRWRVVAPAGAAMVTAMAATTRRRLGVLLILMPSPFDARLPKGRR
jgi:hypothetical protein